MSTSRALPFFLRIAAIALAVIGVIDPRVQLAERVPPAVDLQIVAGGDDAAGSATMRVLTRLQRSLGDRIAFNSGAQPAARVLVGDVSASDLPALTDVPTSVIAVEEAAPPNVRIVAAESPRPVPLGWSARFDATIEAVGMAGRTSTVVLEQDGVTLTQTTHAWRSDRERTRLEMFYAAPVPGVSRVALRVQPADGESVTHDNRVDLWLKTIDRHLNVLVHESRPSWGAAFVRRSLEASPAFDVAAITGASRGLDVSAGAAPRRLTAGSLEAFDLVVLGAPEELSRSDVDALRSFVRVRGGAAIFVPDRRPSGSYLEMLPASRFDEVLVANPMPLRSTQPGSIHASELAIPRDAAGARVIASIDYKDSDQPVIVQWMAGAGRILFAGALDGWRFRSSDSDGYGRFWETLAATQAMLSPRPIEFTLHPAIARPGETVTIRASMRRTELDETAMRTRTPPVEVRMIAADGASTPIRLWPAAEAGVFEGRIAAPAAGRYDVQVSSGQTTVDDVLIAAMDVQHAAGDMERQADAARAVAASTGGVAVAANDLTPIERVLTSLPHGERMRARHPVRSMLYVASFAVLTCAEWALRRRRGLR